MADKWMDERDRMMRERDWRRSEDTGGDQRRFQGGEGRSFGDDDFRARRSGADRDRVFGERETGMGYGGEESGARSGSGAYGGGRGGASGAQGGAQGGGGRPAWQDPNYGGVSPAMKQDEYDLEHRAERYQSSHGGGRGQQGGGGRFYGDGGGERIYREEYGQGGVEYGDVPRGYDAGRGSGRMASGGTGGYDYERGYGDAGRQRFGEGRGYEDRGQQFERAGHDAGDFFRRAGERVASWFGGEGGQDDGRGNARGRDFRGMGPKGYKRADERINDEAHERLTDDPWVDATNINISVSGGEVTLSGTVENRESKHRAERCVEEISGVNHVQNNLRIDRGSILTSPSRGFGDSVLEHQMRGENAAGENLAGGTGQNGSATKTSTSTDTGKSR